MIGSSVLIMLAENLGALGYQKPHDGVTRQIFLNGGLFSLVRVANIDLRAREHPRLGGVFNTPCRTKLVEMAECADAIVRLIRVPLPNGSQISGDRETFGGSVALCIRT